MSKYIEKSVKAGIITSQQADMIYEIINEDTLITPRKFLLIFLVIVSIALSIAAICIAFSEWTFLSYGMRIGGLICLTFISSFAGYCIRANTKYPKTGAIFLFLSALFFGALIFITAKTYAVNPSEEFHYLILLWMISIFPYIYIFKSRTVALFVSFLFFVWFALFLMVVSDKGILITRPILPFIYYILGIFFFCFGKLNGAVKDFLEVAKMFQKIGLCIICIAAFLLTFPYFANAEGRSVFDFIDIYYFSIKVTGFAFVALAIMFLSSFFVNPLSKAGSLIENVLFAVLIVFCIAISVNDTMPLLAISALFVFITIALIFIGYRKKDEFYSNLGIVSLLIFVLSKYFMLCRDMFSGTFYFAIGAFLIIALSLLFENGRRLFKRHLLSNETHKEVVK
jgi:uncharacterized membrane protein